MQNREAGIALCGVVVGVLLGAGSLLYAQGASLGADAGDVAYERIRPRDTVKRLRAAHPSGLVEKKAEKTETIVAVPSEDCAMTTGIVKELMSSVNYWVPNNVQNTQRRAEIKKAGDAIIARYCPAAASTSMKKDAAAPSMKAAAPVDVDNDCEQYEVGGIRYNKCMANEAKNKSYNGMKVN